MINISVRQKRLFKLWAKQFAIVMVSGIAMFGTVCGIAIGLIMLGKAYGPPAVFLSLIGGFAIIGGLTISHAIANEKLTKMEREEERTMDALKTDYSNEKDKLFSDLRSQINQMHRKMYTSKGSNNVTKI
jgi:acetyl-CoA carboxylase carboxyltransferase component